jgi:ribonuclease BN (tRNA processing enzyme)
VIGPSGTKKFFRALFAALPGFTQAPFAVHFKEVADRAFTIGKTTVIPRTVTHAPELHCVGYRIEYGGKALAYSGDSQYCASLVRLCGDVDLAVLDCSFPASRPNPVHMHAGQCGRVAREAGIGQLVLSHFYPITERYNVREQAGEAFGGKIVVGKDLMAIKL